MVKVTGAKAHAARLKRIGGPEMRRQVGAALFAGGSLIETEWANLITEGAVSGPNHVVSAPGEAPNADTHEYDRSITTVRVEELKVEVSSDLAKAVALEFGTSKMAERPAARPATARKRDEATDLVRKAVKKIVAGGKVVP